MSRDLTVPVSKRPGCVKADLRIPTFRAIHYRRDGLPTVDAHEAFYDGRGNMPLGGEEINSGYKARNLTIWNC